MLGKRAHLSRHLPEYVAGESSSLAINEASCSRVNKCRSLLKLNCEKALTVGQPQHVLVGQTLEENGCKKNAREVASLLH